jgi:hypothetical protein
MPPKSKVQAGFMRAVAGGTAKNPPKGLSQTEAKEMVSGHPTKRLPQRVKKGR